MNSNKKLAEKNAEVLPLFLEEKGNRLKTLNWWDDQVTMC
jgi:hypothetical protein